MKFLLKCTKKKGSQIIIVESSGIADVVLKDYTGQIAESLKQKLISLGLNATIEKKKVELPEKIVNIVKCKNPRCITTTEQGVQQIFKLTDASTRTYRCLYCEEKFDDK